MREKARQREYESKTDRESVLEKEKKWLMGQQMINVEKTNHEGESKTDRESVHAKEKN